MNTRMLVVVFAGQEAAAIQGLPAVLATARADRRQVRLASFHSLPAPRLDRYDRVVADADREMARIVEATTGALTRAVRQLSVDPAEIVVRFGSPGREVLRETDVFTPDLVAFFSPPATALATRLGVGILRRRVARRQARLLVVETPLPGRRQLPATPALALP
jgi:nucleotide-binding universal stress UspA family protein